MLVWSVSVTVSAWWPRGVVLKFGVRDSGLVILLPGNLMAYRCLQVRFLLLYHVFA